MLAGTCHETANGTFLCTCPSNWQGLRCEKPVNYCSNATCLNNGVCRSSSKNYTCECLGSSYSGRHCEVKSSQMELHQAVSRSFAYVAICALLLVMLFIVAMDVMKYCFGIDDARQARRDVQFETAKTRNVIRFIYVHSSPMDEVLTKNCSISIV